MKKLFIASLVSAMMFQSCDVLQNMALAPTTLETTQALKKILNSSAFRAITTLRDINNDGVEAVLPEDLKPVLSTLNTLGMGGEIDKVTNEIKHISGVALKESEGIMTDAIRELRFEDAVAVVLGGPEAATEVLRQAMYTSVKNRYSAQLNAELDNTDINKYWPVAVGAYNAFSDEKIETDLASLLAEKAVDGLFLTMGNKEAEIRNDYESLGSSVVNKVFDYYTKEKS